MSTAPICGVREYARVLDHALLHQGVVTRTLWWDRDEAWSAPRALGRFRAWMDEVADAVRLDRPDWIVCHYSAFAYGHRGIPTLVPTMAERLKGLGVPVVPILHEMAIPWRGRGWRGSILALTQRAALAELLRVSRGAVVTTEDRLSWLGSRPYVPGRPALCQPVFSCLVAPEQKVAAEAELECASTGPSLGAFGWAEGGVRIEPVVGALAILAHRGVATHLTLIGSPGPDSPSGRNWRAAAARVGCGGALTFTGVLEPGALAGELARHTVLVVADQTGPSSRRTTLAAALALGKPVVALDGPHRWRQAAEAGAILLADGPRSMAGLIEGLMLDRRRCQDQGAAALAFYRRNVDPDLAGARLVEFFRNLQPSLPPTGVAAGWKLLAASCRASRGLRGRGRVALLVHGRLASRMGTSSHRMWDIPMRRGHRMAVPWSADQAWVAAFTGGYDDAEIDFLLAHAEPGTFLMDVGACLGFWTVPLAVAASQRDCRVLAVEPVTSNLEVLTGNIARNHLAHLVDVLPVALGAKPGQAVAAVDRGGVGNAALDPPLWQGGRAPTGAPVESVPVAMLDDVDLPPTYRRLRCSAVKMDVEGWEMAVLEGAVTFIARHRPTILGEFSLPWMTMRQIAHDAPQRWAERAGYSCHEVVLTRSRRLSDKASLALVPLHAGETRSDGPLLLTPDLA